MSNPDFTGKRNVQLVPGVLYGLRAFFLNYDGTLASPVYTKEQWTAGETEAVCKSGWEHAEGVPVGSILCRCGFYSYHRIDLAEDYYYGPSIGMLGVIEAYGHVTIGNQGMRSSKARLAGLVVPRKKWTKRPVERRHRLSLLHYPSVPTFQTVEAAAEAFRINGRPKILA